MKSSQFAVFFGVLVAVLFGPLFTRNGLAEPTLPLGGVGAGNVVMFGADGRFSTGGAQPEVLPGSFMAVRTVVDGHVETRSLVTGASPILPGVASLLFTREFPQAVLTVKDTRLGADVSVLAFSPIIPHQMPDSALPGFSLVYRFSNPLSKPVTISAILSWQAAPSRFHSASAGPLAYKPGTFGLTLHSKSSGDETSLAVEPRHPDARVTTTTWQPNGKQPPWWQDFAETGSVTTAAAGTGSTAAVICVTFTLQPGDQAVIPFGVATYRTTADDAGYHYYHAVASSSAEAAVKIAKNWLPLHVLTREWQYQILFSNLPETVKSGIIQAAVPLVTRTRLDSKGLFHYSQGSRGSSQQAVCDRLLAWPMLLSFFPHHAAATLLNDPNSVPAIIEAYLYVKWTGDLEWLKQILPALPKIVTTGGDSNPITQLAAIALRRLNAIASGGPMPNTALTLSPFDWHTPTGRTVRILASLAEVPVSVQPINPPPPTKMDDPAEAGLCQILEGLPEAGLGTLNAIDSDNGWHDATAWNSLYVVSGFRLDAIEGTMAVQPSIPGTWRSMRSPVFLPSLLLSVDFRPAVHGGSLDITLERQFAFTDLVGLFKSSGAAFTLHSISIPSPPPFPAGTTPPKPQIFMSLADAPVGFQSESPVGVSFTLSPLPPLPLQVGDVLHVTVR